ncbi:MAG: hypothetical protein IJT54_01865 [Candidatus Methanomethylophilaceae archaeon]|nr:hypothetical protein [Candidatus Methanomethylophilaceae archaeon]
MISRDADSVTDAFYISINDAIQVLNDAKDAGLDVFDSDIWEVDDVTDLKGMVGKAINLLNRACGVLE